MVVVLFVTLAARVVCACVRLFVMLGVFVALCVCLCVLCVLLFVCEVCD